MGSGLRTYSVVNESRFVLKDSWLLEGECNSEMEVRGKVGGESQDY